MKRSSFYSLLLVLVLPILLTAQTITGKLVDQNSDGLSDLQLQLYINPMVYYATSTFDGSFTFNNITDVKTYDELPTEYSVSEIYPNPFNPKTRIVVTLAGSSRVKIEVFNLLGQRAIEEIERYYGAGTSSIDLELNGLPNGIYFARISLDDKYIVVRKLMLLYGSQHLSSSNFGPVSKPNKTTLDGQEALDTNIDSLVVTGSYLNRTVFTNLPALTGDTLNLDNLSITLTNTIWYDGTLYPHDSLHTWGIGFVQNEYAHNDKDYAWYIDQGYTGPASNNNCGPSSVTMAIKWYDKNFSKTAEEARNTYYLSGGWWFTNNIIDYLNLYSASNTTVSYSDVDQLKTIIMNGDIAILCITTAELIYNSNGGQRVGRFYSYAGGHFLVIKGVRVVDNITYFETYDPNNWGAKYSDNSDKGKNRHYKSDQLDNAIKTWWNYIIIVRRNLLSKASYQNEVDPAAIPHMWGK